MMYPSSSAHGAWCVVPQDVLTDFLRIFPQLFSASQNVRFCQAITSSFERRQWKRLSAGLRNAAKMANEKVLMVSRQNTVSPDMIFLLFSLHLVEHQGCVKCGVSACSNDTTMFGEM